MSETTRPMTATTDAPAQRPVRAEAPAAAAPGGMAPLGTAVTGGTVPGGVIPAGAAAPGGPTAPPAPAPSRPAGAPGTPPAAARPVRAGIGPAAFRTGEGPEERLIGQVAFALAAEAGAAPQTPEAMRALRDQASASLSDFAFRYLHNRAEDIRRDAVAQATARSGRPPRFPLLVLANLTALAIAAAAGLALAANPHLFASLLGSGFVGSGFLGQ